MPEQITKFPEVTIRVLKGAGARCGEGMDQKILTKCPPERFCSLPTGEICVYGINEIPKMTQITTKELARVVCPPMQQSSLPSAAPGGVEAGIPAVSLILALVLWAIWPAVRQR